MTELTLVRHGRTQANIDGIYCGRLNPPLTQAGVEDAQAAALALSGTQFSRVYCSDALRARQTAQLIAPEAQAAALPGLREMNFGAFEGLCADAIQQRMPTEWQAYMDDYKGFTFPGGENVRDYLTNAAQCINAIIRETGEGHALIVSHKGFILSVLSHLLHGDSEHLFCYDIKPAGIARLSVGQGCAVLRQLI